jgi:MoaA/NifB/PqqE/SkfB family radical SAM enzyme
MALRRMSNSFKGFKFYESSFDPSTGVLVRSVEVPEFDKKYHSSWSKPRLVESVASHLGVEIGRQYRKNPEFLKLDESWGRKFGRVVRHRYKNSDGTVEKSMSTYVHSWRSQRAFSPVPETIDVKITDWCNFGCSYCYMDSTTKGKHAPRELLTTIFDGLKTAPYQIAFGGGEPTAHPDFPWFLQYTREKGTVPNYTTAGHILRDDVFEATNKFCGGVALTYHAFKGPEYFKKTYETWRSRLDRRVQLNVHVIFDKDVTDNLLDLAEVGLRDLNVVLLAYYPSVGRSTWENVPPKGVYEVTLPEALTAVREVGFRVAFSEGLLPYFLSHQLPEVDTTFAGQQEGVYSCYVDDEGFVSHSSFDPDDHQNPAMSIYQQKFQKIWNKMDVGYPRGFDVCENCKFEAQCHTPNDASFMLCKFASHNRVPPKSVPERKRKLAVLKD